MLKLFTGKLPDFLGQPSVKLSDAKKSQNNQSTRFTAHRLSEGASLYLSTHPAGELVTARLTKVPSLFRAALVPHLSRLSQGCAIRAAVRGDAAHPAAGSYRCPSTAFTNSAAVVTSPRSGNSRSKRTRCSSASVSAQQSAITTVR